MPVTVLRRGNPNKNTISTYPVEFYHRCFFPSFFVLSFCTTRMLRPFFPKKFPSKSKMDSEPHHRPTLTFRPNIFWAKCCQKNIQQRCVLGDQSVDHQHWGEWRGQVILIFYLDRVGGIKVCPADYISCLHLTVHCSGPRRGRWATWRCSRASSTITTRSSTAKDFHNNQCSE